MLPFLLPTFILFCFRFCCRKKILVSQPWLGVGKVSAQLATAWLCLPHLERCSLVTRNKSVAFVQFPLEAKVSSSCLPELFSLCVGMHHERLVLLLAPAWYVYRILWWIKKVLIAVVMAYWKDFKQWQKKELSGSVSRGIWTIQGKTKYFTRKFFLISSKEFYLFPPLFRNQTQNIF